MTHLNLEGLENELYTHLGLDINTDQADLPIVDADILINRSFIFMVNQVKLRLKERTVTFDCIAGQRTYHLPEDLSKLTVISVLDPTTNQHVRLHRMITREYENRYNEETTAQGLPTHYVRECDLIRLFPTPDKVYSFTLKYDNLPQWYSQTNETISNLPEEYEEVVLTGAVYRGFNRLGDYVRGNAARSEAIGLMKTLITTVEEEEEDSSYDGIDMAWGPSLDKANRNPRNFNQSEDIQRNR